MATQDFGLSFTVSAPAIWVDNENGILGEASTIFSQILNTDKTGEAGTIFADVYVPEAIGESSNVIASGMCFSRSFMSPPLISILSGPGTSSTSCGI